MESLIEEIDFGENINTEVKLKTEVKKPFLKENQFKLIIQRTKENKHRYLELVKESYSDCPHPTIMLVYSGYLYAERFENIKRKKRNRKGLINKPKFSFKQIFGK